MRFWSASLHSLSFLVSLPPWSGELQRTSNFTWRQLLAPIRSLRRGSSPLTTGMSWSTFHPQTDRRLEPSGSFLWSRATSSRCQRATRPYSCFDLFQFHFLQLWLIEWKVHVARFGTDPSHCLKSVRFFKKGNISVGIDPSAVAGIKTWLRRDDAAVGPSVISCVSVQWNSPLHSIELQQKRMRQLPNQPPKTSSSCFLWFRREIWFVAWTALTERTPRDVWVKMSDRFIPRSRSSHMKLLSCSILLSGFFNHGSSKCLGLDLNQPIKYSKTEVSTQPLALLLFALVGEWMHEWMNEYQVLCSLTRTLNMATQFPPQFWPSVFCKQDTLILLTFFLWYPEPPSYWVILPVITSFCQHLS